MSFNFTDCYRLFLNNTACNMVNKGMIATFVGVCGAAILYRLYNLKEFEKYSAKKMKEDQKAKQKMEYQKFLSERRQKR